MDVDVLVVGAGMTGLTTSILLEEYGVKALTISKHRGTAPTPRAHITNQRTMEVFRDMGIEDRVLEVATKLTTLGNGVMATSLTGMEIARYSCYGGGAAHASDFSTASPSEMVNVPQHIVEKLLLDRAREKGADVRFGNELVHIEDGAKGVVARIRNRQTKEEYTVRARYAVAADGGRSSVADKLGFGFTGESGFMSMLSVWLEADLTKYTAHRPAAIYLILQPGNAYWVGSGTCVVVKPFTEWVLNRQYDAADGEPDTSDEAIISHARKVLGVPDDLPMRVKDASKWQVNNVVASEYRRGHVFLAGDAAHRHPPASGLGSNTCVQDAYNLAWKLALVTSGIAGDRLLDSYNQERQPVGKQIVAHAIQTLYNMTKIPETLGFRKGQALEDGYATLESLFSDDPGAEDRRARLEEVVKLQDRRSNAVGLHLGNRYKDSCSIVYDGTPFPEYKQDPVLYYEPTTHPGGYLPHAFVEHKGRRISTLDIIPHARFGLIVGIGGKSWTAAASQVSQELGVELSVCPVGYRCTYDDVLGRWSALREIKDGGALLVRPDRHIAWRSVDRVTDPTQALRSAFSHVLARNILKGAL
ncbi:FAD binding domain-containing protein [Bisporella sp. PMI_857]|nr:FAD binding domain-containing protein [Bisporella sp. PMI_857]